MSRYKTQLLLHPFFLFNLFLLIANDHWWKHAYGNALTGKISDFAGLFVMAVSLVACCRLKKIHAVITTALFFIWWKSALSQPVVDAFRLARVIDYSDLWALTMLPVIFFIRPFAYGHGFGREYNLEPRHASHKHAAMELPCRNCKHSAIEPHHPRLRVLRKLQVKYLLPLVVVITWTAMVATTMPYRVGGYRYPEGHVTVDKQWTTRLTIDQFFHQLDSLHIPWKKDSLVYLPVNTNGLMMVVKSVTDSVYRMTPVDDLKDTVLYYEKNLGTHYTIPYLALERDTITNIRFRLYDNGKKRVLDLMEMTIPPDLSYKFWTERPLRKRYLSMLRSFMLESKKPS